MLSYPDFQEKTIAIVFSHEGQKFAIKNDNLIVTDKEDNVVLQTTCHRLLALWIIGNCSITTALMSKSKKFAFPILLLSSQFRHIGIWNASTEGNFLLRQRQYHYQSLEIARHLIHNKMNNQMALLHSIRQKTPFIKENINRILQYQGDLQKMQTLQEIMGLEGIASKLFFTHWFHSLPYQSRKPRTKCDPINVLMDIGYTQLFYFIENMLHLYGFDVYQGVLHRQFYQRKSLVCDLQEPFRCIIDKKIKTAYHLKQFQETDFELIQSQYRLKQSKTKHYTNWLIQAILEYKKEIFLYCQTYYRAFISQKPITTFPVFNIQSKHD